MALAVTPLSPAAIALNRFGLGARTDDDTPANARYWLTDQFDHFEVRSAGFASLADAGLAVQRFREQKRATREAAKTEQMGDARPDLKVMRQDFGRDAQALYRDAVRARVLSAVTTPAPFVERLVHFWSNHFCISADNPQITAYAGAFERDAIRPHVLGRFSDMLLAAEQHPAMLIYLNQATSIGPESLAAQRSALRNPEHKPGLNENLGREIMELHTLGVRSGYTQTDVTEFARALTGWTVDGFGPGSAGQGNPDSFAFRPALHEPGARTILGKRYDEPGEGQAKAALADFARTPATAIHIATKLARHFAGDTPPPLLVTRLAAAFEKSDGDLPSVYRTLIASPEPWVAAPLKFKTPWEWMISALRGVGLDDLGPMQPAGMAAQLGQPVWKPGSPAGWDDIAASWAGPDALLRRVELAARLAAPLGDRLDARKIGARLMPASLSTATAEQITRAESPTSALALLLVSPDFLRR